MNLKSLLTVAALLVVSGCAGMTAEQKREFQLLSDRVLLNQAQGEEVLSRLDELETKLELMRARIAPDRNEKAAPAAGSTNEPSPVREGREGKAGPGSGSFAMPEGLKVVSLSTPDVPAQAVPAKSAAVKAAAAARGPEAGGTDAAIQAAGRDDRRAAVKAALVKKAGPGAGPEELYRRGREEYTSGRLAAARDTFLSLEKSYPGHSLADNALYWVGETYYTEKDYAMALEVFSRTADKYPEGNKAPDSLLKAGLSAAELGDHAGAVSALDLLVERYPDTPPAQKAVRARAGIDGTVDAARKKQAAQR